MINYLTTYFVHLLCPIMLKGAPLVAWASLVAQLAKNPPAMWEPWAQPLGREDPLETGTGTHSSVWPGEVHGLYSP